jgi:hypothetical protein
LIGAATSGEPGALARGGEAFFAAAPLFDGVFERELRRSFVDSVQRYYEDYIDLLAELHQSSPQAGLEARALREVFPDNDPVVTSIKGTIGESGATGAAACIAAVLCGAVQEVPPISGIDNVAPGAAELNIAKTRCRLHSPFALINSVSSGGALFSVVLRVQQ